MKCEDAIYLFTDSLMDRVTPDDASSLSRHLETCPSCRGETRRLREAWEGMGKLPGLAVAPETTAAAAAETRRLLNRDSRPARASRRWAASIALLLAGGAAGYAIGQGGARPLSSGAHTAGPAPATSYLFLVRGDEPDASVAAGALTAEYQAWAGELARQERLLAAEKLTSEPGRWISGAAAGDDRSRSDVQGFFLIRADSYDEAVALARASPHVAYGGTFEIRQVEPLTGNEAGGL